MRNIRQEILISATASTLLSVLLSAACLVNAPPRPQTVNENAIWAGGSDGGVWIFCEEEGREATNRFLCIVSDENGETLRKESFELRRTDRQDSRSDNGFKVKFELVKRTYSIDELKQVGFSFYDGTKIGFTNELVLIPAGRNE